MSALSAVQRADASAGDSPARCVEAVRCAGG